MRFGARGKPKTMNAPAINLRNASLAYEKATVFRDLSLSLEAGTWTGLLGQSGVGKTSLLRFVAGLTRGAGVRGDVAAGDGAPLMGRIAYMSQQDLLLPWLSVLDNVTLGVRLRDGVAAARAVNGTAKHLLAQVGLAECASDRPAALSGGMRQRVALARTLMEDRPVVLMDEPFSALDAITRYRLQNMAAELLNGKTVLLVTHDPNEALRLCHRIFVLYGSPARLEGPIEPQSAPPRASDTPEVVSLQSQLLSHLLGREAA